MNVVLSLLPLAAVGFSLIFLLLGGGFFGAVIVYFVAKIFGQ